MKVIPNKIFIIVFSTLFFISIGTAASFSATYYIDPNHSNASDENPGTQESSPWRTLSKAANTLEAGDTARLKAGTYSTNGTGQVYLPAFRFINSGTQENPITIESYSGNPDDINITLTSGTGGPVIGQYQNNWLIIKNVTITEGPTYLADSGVVSFRSGSGGRIEGCKIIGVSRSRQDNHSGVRAENTSNITVSHCEISGFRNPNEPSYHNNTATLIYGVSGFVVEHTTMSNNNCGSYDKQAGVDSIYRYNKYHNNNMHIFLQSSNGYTRNQNTRVHNNVFLGGGDEGGVVIGINSDHPQIYNNTFYNVNATVSDYAAVAYTQTSATEIDLWNNIFSNCEKNIRFRDTDDVLFCDYNHFYNSGSKPFTENWTSVEISGWSFDRNSALDNPNFINPGGTLAEDYKRSAYPEEGRGGSYEEVIGAYVTNNESIGLKSEEEFGSEDPLPPLQRLPSTTDK